MTGIILAGGKNSRISMKKALIKLGQHTIIERTARILQDIFKEVIIVTNNFEDYLNLGVILTNDLIPQKGPLGGIYSGLKLSSNRYNFIVACDMPFIEPAIIRCLQKRTRTNVFDIIVPERDGVMEPLFAIYSTNCIQPIYDNLISNNLKIRGFYNKVKVKKVACSKLSSLKSFFNINTKEDLLIARKLNNG